MNGSQHYTEAEKALQSSIDDHELGSDGERAMIAEAQVHATLALAAATAEAGGLVTASALGIPSDWAKAVSS